MPDATAAPPTREEAQSTAFETSPEPIEIEGLVFRPFTSFSWERCQRMEIEIALESFEHIEEMPAPAVLREVAFVTWMQTAPAAEVARTFAGDDFDVWAAVEAFEAELNGRPDRETLWIQLTREVTRVMLEGHALLFSISETQSSKEATADAEKPPGNL